MQIDYQLRRHMQLREQRKKPEPVVPVMREVIFFAILLFAASLLALCVIGCNPVEALYDRYHIQDDNVVEEMIEAGVKYETGVDIDLTPRSEE